MTKQSRARLIYLIVYLAYTSIYISRISLSVAETSLEALGIFDAAGYGVIGGLFSTVYSVGRLVNGTIGDKAPPWLMLTVGLGVGGLSCLLIGFLPPYVGILLLWGVNAYAQSMLWSSVLCVVSSIYRGPRLKRMTSLMVTAVAAGNIISILLSGWIITAFGVRLAFIVPGSLNILLGAVVFFATRRLDGAGDESALEPDGGSASADNLSLDKPGRCVSESQIGDSAQCSEALMEESGEGSVGARVESAPPTTAATGTKHFSILELIKNRDLLLMSIPSVLHGVMKENVTVWMVAYIAYAFGTNLGESAWYVMLIPIIGLVGRLSYPALLKLSGGNENSVSLLGFRIAAFASVLLLFRGLGVAVAVILLGLVYAASSVVNTSITSIYPMSYLKTGNVSSVSGILDFASYLGAGLSSALYGVIIKYFGYEPMFISWAVCSIVSLLVIGLINRLRRKALVAGGGEELTTDA